MNPRKSELLTHRLAILLLSVTTLVAFAGVRSLDFVNWDDRQNLLDHDSYRGFSLEHLTWMFSTNHGGHYHPLTWLSWSIDYALWGLNPAGFHLTNLVLHLFTAVGLYFMCFMLLRRTCANHEIDTPQEKSTGAEGIATIAALVGASLFAVHPLRVESVAWITERRDVLSGVFYTLTVAFYLVWTNRSHDKPRAYLYVASLLCFVAGLLSKASGMVLPVVLLILDRYPLRRLGRQNVPGENSCRMRDLLIEKLPFFALATGSALLAANAQSQAGAMWSLDDHPLTLRVGQAFYGLAFYPLKTLVPVQLSPLYEQSPTASPLDTANVLSFVVVMAATSICYFFRRRAPGLLTAWFSYLVLATPTLGLVQSGPQVVADRYSYFACMPFHVLAAAGILIWSRQQKQAASFRLPVSGALCMAFLLLTRQQVMVWRDSESLWSTVLARGTSRGIANANMASLMNQKGDHDAACRHARHALAVLPGNRTAHYAMARCAYALGDYDRSLEHYERCQLIDERLGRTDAGVYFGLAASSGAVGRIDDAQSYYQTLVAMDQSNPLWPFYWSGMLASSGRKDEAIEILAQSIRRFPKHEASVVRLAQLYRGQGNPARSISLLENLTKKYDAALIAQRELAWILATTDDSSLRDGNRAVRIMETVQRAKAAEDAAVRDLEVLAAALAESGDFGQARTVITRAIDMLSQTAPKSDRPKRQDTLRRQLDRYRNSQPWHTETADID